MNADKKNGEGGWASELGFFRNVRGFLSGWIWGRARTLRPVVERAEVFPGAMDWVTYERRRPLRFRVLYVERLLLGTPYPRVVQRVRKVVRQSAQQGG